MESLLKGIPHDILVTGKTQEQHLENLKEVLVHFQQARLHLKKQKCQFLTRSVEYLGYVIDQHGLHPSEEKVKTVKSVPKPQNLTELKAYLGLLTTVNFYQM